LTLFGLKGSFFSGKLHSKLVDHVWFRTARVNLRHEPFKFKVCFGVLHLFLQSGDVLVVFWRACNAGFAS